MPLSPDALTQAYRRMKMIREFEERLHAEIAKGEIAGFTHLYAGQEAVAVGVCENLGPTGFHRLDASRSWPLHRQGL